jgi:hypothetical protein
MGCFRRVLPDCKRASACRSEVWCVAALLIAQKVDARGLRRPLRPGGGGGGRQHRRLQHDEAPILQRRTTAHPARSSRPLSAPSRATRPRSCDRACLRHGGRTHALPRSTHSNPGGAPATDRGTVTAARLWNTCPSQENPHH